MKQFPKGTEFKYQWRTYQARVLKELEMHLEDNRLHVVAAPGSGKTLLGLEVVVRLDRPTLILAPTLAIRDQWVTRLVGFFLPNGSETPEWISTDIRSPRFLTVSTYQGLYAACTSDFERLDNEEEPEIENENHDNNETTYEDSTTDETTVIDRLNEIGVGTIVLDEAHHLRSNWWRILIQVIQGLPESTLLALTATPPYDVSIYEWERYRELCGPIDEEVSVPELVLENNLCPHQDLVVLSYPSIIEDDKIKKFDEDISEFIENIEERKEFIEEVKNHRWLQKTEENIDEILDDPTFFSSLLVFLRHCGERVPK